MLGGLGIVVGLATWGYKIIDRIGKDLTKITPSRGFVVELSAATTVIIASRAEIPVSTTHCQVGSILGCGMAGGMKNIQWGLVKGILFSWLITLPFTGFLSAALFSFGYYSPYYSPYWRWGRRGLYNNLYGYDIHDNYRNNTNVSYNRGRRGSSSNVVVYSNGRSSTSNDPDTDSERVRNYNKTREVINNIGDSGSSSNSNARTYLDPRSSNMNGSRNLRNYINKGVISNQSSKSSSTLSTSKRYYNDPYSNPRSTWGLSGRNGNSNLGT